MTDTESPDRPALEITPAMIEAGVTELRERCFGEALSVIVVDVYVAMWSAAHG